MSIEKLNVVDFAKLGVHRPFTSEEISEVQPQAVVDKTLADGNEAGVGEEKSYPHEVPLPSNVEILDTSTSLDLAAVEVLRSAHDAGLTELVICGVDAEGHEYLIRTNADIATAMWYVQRASYLLNRERDIHRAAALAGEDN